VSFESARARVFLARNTVAAVLLVGFLEHTNGEEKHVFAREVDALVKCLLRFRISGHLLRCVGLSWRRR
jgi:hypothetical protein